MGTKRKRHSASSKAKVALAAYKGEKAAAGLITQHQVSPGQAGTWKKQLLPGAASVLEPKAAQTVDGAVLAAPLYEGVGRLEVELGWLGGKLPARPIDGKRDIYGTRTHRYPRTPPM